MSALETWTRSWAVSVFEGGLGLRPGWTTVIAPFSAPADERYLGGPHGQVKDVGPQRQPGHVNHRPRRVVHVHRRLGGDRPVLHPVGHRGLRVPDVDLAGRGACAKFNPLL